MDVLFLDANVLFSAAYRCDSGLRRLWDLDDVVLITSAYAAEEARRNLPHAPQKQQLADLLGNVRIVAGAGVEPLPLSGPGLPPKDYPILLAAIASRATHLLTGDVKHFGPYLGKAVGGVLILRPGEYLRTRK